MKKIVLFFALALGLAACGKQNPQVEDRNPNTQNPIMPIVYSNPDGNGQAIYLTDYLPQVSNWDSLKFFTEPSYRVVSTENGIITLAGDHTLSVLSVLDQTDGTQYDIPILPKAKYEVGLVTQSFTDSTITIGV
jgi:hypothetical protein